MTILETPDTSREESRSGLDFAYMALVGATVPMPLGTAADPFAGLADDEEDCVEFVQECARQVGVTLHDTFDAIVAGIVEEEPLLALRRRGTVLVKGRGIAISLGATRRVVIVSGGDIVVRYLLDQEVSNAYWDKAGTLEGMVAL